MLSPSLIQLIGAALFAVAVAHTFATRFFQRLAHAQPAHAGLWHLLGEVETAFGLWALVLVVAIFLREGKSHAVGYLESRNFTEPMFVFVIMVIAGSRPILQLAMGCVRVAARATRLPAALSIYFVALSLVPLLGSFITEPAAMTLAALILRDAYYSRQISSRLKYATIGALFVNVSIGGTLTPYAAPPVLMVAASWGWDLAHMLANFGWRAALAVFANAFAVMVLFRRELMARGPKNGADSPAIRSVPNWVVGVHLAFLVAVVVFAHYAAVFMAIFLFFLGFAEAYNRHQDRLILREGLMVAFFLAGLITLGGYQKWWLQETLAGMDPELLYWGATALTAITDNAALTYLGSLVDAITDASKYALVAGAVTGGGLTIIANAPNPAGFSILKDSFQDQAISPLGLFLAALPPTAVAALAFTL
ncbi:MAG: putative Na+/H+ antiporter [Betaproteobacteria bacterium]|nr:putative Na+/H+ antiporter [Betaproteobacteria bacterium]